MGGATGRLAEVGGELKFLPVAGTPVTVLVLLEVTPPPALAEKTNEVKTIIWCSSPSLILLWPQLYSFPDYMDPILPQINRIMH